MKFPWEEDAKPALCREQDLPRPRDSLGQPHSASRLPAESGIQGPLLGPTPSQERSSKYGKRLSSEDRGVSILGWALPLHCGQAARGSPGLEMLLPSARRAQV